MLRGRGTGEGDDQRRLGAERILEQIELYMYTGSHTHRAEFELGKCGLAQSDTISDALLHTSEVYTNITVSIDINILWTFT